MDINKFYDIIDKIDSALDYYDFKHMSDTKFYLQLSNNDKLNIKYDENCIAHLLGVNIDFLRSTGLYKGSSYGILCEIVDNPKQLWHKIEQGIINPDRLFSSFVDEKLENFNSICGINIFDIEFVVNYKKDRNLSTEEPLDDGYYVGYLTNSGLNVIGYLRNEINGNYYPHTSLLFEQDSPESNNFLNRLMKNQVVSTVDFMKKNTFVDYDNIEKRKYFYNNYDKINKLKISKHYAELHGGVTDTAYSNIFYVNKVINLEEERASVVEALEEIASKMKDRKIIDINQLRSKYDGISDSILKVVGAHNDSLVNDSSNDGTYSYQSLIEEFDKCKKNLENQKVLVEKLREANNKLAAENELLILENAEHEENRKQIVNILTRTKK